MKCWNCQSFNLIRIGDGTSYLCDDCGTVTEGYSERRKVAPVRMSPYERTRAAVYATGNKWAIENFNATH